MPVYTPNDVYSKDTEQLSINTATEFDAIARALQEINEQLQVLYGEEAEPGTGTTGTPPASGGEANTASNVGAAGFGTFYQKTGVNLEFLNHLGQYPIEIAQDLANRVLIHRMAPVVGGALVGNPEISAGNPIYFKLSDLAEIDLVDLSPGMKMLIADDNNKLRAVDQKDVGGALEFNIAVASTEWIINHNLNRPINMEVYSDGKVKMIAEIVYTNANQARALFESAVTGFAFVN